MRESCAFVLAVFVLTAFLGTHGHAWFARGVPGVVAGCSTNGSDGFAGAPTATIQYPNELTSYTTKPSWCVAGIGYAVGIPTAQSLSDPFPAGSLAAGLVSNGCTYPNPPNHVIVCTTASQTISGWDFSLEGGWTIQLQGNSTVLKNSNFKVGANARPFIFIDNGANGVTLENNIMDGAAANTNPAGGLIQGSNGGTPCGTVVIEYNWIKNAYYQHMQLGICSGNTATTVTVKYNLLQMAGYGSPFGAHGDIVQIVSSNGGTPTLNSFTADYNFVLQDDPTANWATQGYSAPYSGGNTLIVLAEDISNNTFIIPHAYLSTRNINDAILIDTASLNGTATVNNNYVDPTGISSAGAFAKGVVTGNPYSGTVTTSGNLNMISGSTCVFNGTGCP